MKRIKPTLVWQLVLEIYENTSELEWFLKN